MKTTKNLTTLISAVVLSIFLFSCSNNLSNQEAQSLIIKTLNLPQKFREDVSGQTLFTWPILVKNGFIYEPGNCSFGCTLRVTDKGKPYLTGEGKESMFGGNILQFQGFDIDFNEVRGIAINKEQQSATVRFSLKATNVSPIARVLEENIDNLKDGELIFKKFDNGWQLATDQNKSSIDMVREIWWRRN